MTLLDVLHVVHRIARSPQGWPHSKCRRPITRTRIGLAGVCLMVLTACGESPAAPRTSFDHAAAARLLPAVIDARLRLAPALNNVGVRQRVIVDLTDLENAIKGDDGARARLQTVDLASILTDYRALTFTSDGADAMAILLVVDAVSQIVDGGRRVAL